MRDTLTPSPAGRLALARALPGGMATAALLPDLVRARGGDGATCLHLGALFAVGTLLSELPAAIFGDRDARVNGAGAWLVRAGVVQAVGLLAMAAAPDLSALALAVIVVGVGAGLATGAEARATLAVVHQARATARDDARAVARFEVLAVLGKTATCFAVALLAVATGMGTRAAIVVSAGVVLIGALLARTVDVDVIAHGRRRAARDGMTDRRRPWSIGPLALLAAVAALSLVARGTDPLDAFAVASRGGLLAAAALLAGKGLVARAIAPSIARVHGVALAAVVAAVPLAFAARLPSGAMLPIVALACGVAGGAAAAARGLLLVRLGPARVGTGAAIEATVRRVAVASAALILAPTVRAHGFVGPYALAAAVAVIGGAAALLPRAGVRRRAATRDAGHAEITAARN
ncbi:MAG: hypothetical protein HYV09_10290 [Deltaproteobacteria bacterium]|nr:hypothetical protein [Deltaproteobacteria bacterium]